MLIAIPSKGRARRITSHRLLGDAAGDAVIFCPAAEVAAYRRHTPEVPVVGVPDHVTGITRTRNWILDWARAHGERWVVQIDDDAIRWTYFEADFPAPGIPVPDDRKRDLLINMFEMAEDLGTNLWGFQVSYDPKFYREYSPFSLTSVVVGNLMGIIEDGQRFDERLPLKEDYDFSLQSLYRHRRVLRCNKYAWGVQHHDTPGGCKTYRSFQAEREAIRILQRKWGPQIVRVHPKKPYEIRVKVPIPGI